MGEKCRRGRDQTTREGSKIRVEVLDNLIPNSVCILYLHWFGGFGMVCGHDSSRCLGHIRDVLWRLAGVQDTAQGKRCQGHIQVAELMPLTKRQRTTRLGEEPCRLKHMSLSITLCASYIGFEHEEPTDIGEPLFLFPPSYSSCIAVQLCCFALKQTYFFCSVFVNFKTCDQT